jgi:hypothetical protein
MKTTNILLCQPGHISFNFQNCMNKMSNYFNAGIKNQYYIMGPTVLTITYLAATRWDFSNCRIIYQKNYR